MVDERAVQCGVYHGAVELPLEPIVLDIAGTSIRFNGSNAYGEAPHNPALGPRPAQAPAWAATDCHAAFLMRRKRCKPDQTRRSASGFQADDG